MITTKNLKDFLRKLGFSEKGNEFVKHFPNIDVYLKVDFAAKQLIYPEDKGLIVNERQTCNFSANENFVVFEAVHRLLEKGYRPEHIELEPKWKLGHGASGGRADILIRDFNNDPLLIIECKTPGTELRKAWKRMLVDGGQLFSYAQQERTTKFLCLYASDFDGSDVTYENYIITLADNDRLLEERKANSPLAYREAKSTEDLFRAWKETYAQDYMTAGIFEDDIPAYQIGKSKYTPKDLKPVAQKDIQPKYHEFATILRQHNVSGRENAFDKLVNLFLCKIVDEIQHPSDLQFYWKGIAYDSFFDLIDRLQRLYRDGMKQFLKEDVTYIDNQTIQEAFKFFKNDPDATRDKILEYFRQQKYFTNNDFAFLDVHNENLFYQNAAILLKIVQMLQGLRLTGNNSHNQFLGDMFEFFLDQGFKQTEGQFFTPLPIVRFILMSLPLPQIVENRAEPPRAVDYACGAGHFLTELASQIKPFVENEGKNPHDYYAAIYGIEKEYRLSKVAKVSTFMYGQGEIKVIYADALIQHPQIKDGEFQILVSNPPYSVKGFLETLPETERARYKLIETVDEKSYPTNNSIETFFIERAKQLLAPGGVAAIIAPTSVLSNTDRTYTRTREILLQSFDIVALVELPSGTFGKTGTNTVILFLRRKDNNPSPAIHYRNRVNSWFKKSSPPTTIQAIKDLVMVYCHCIETDYNNDSIFERYWESFCSSAKIKNLKEDETFQKETIQEFLKTCCYRVGIDLNDYLLENYSKDNAKDSIFETYWKKFYSEDIQKKATTAQQTELIKRFLIYLWDQDPCSLKEISLPDKELLKSYCNHNRRNFNNASSSRKNHPFEVNIINDILKTYWENFHINEKNNKDNKLEHLQIAKHFLSFLRSEIELFINSSLQKSTFQDEDLLKAYCHHIGINFDDYLTLLHGKPNQTLLDTDIFKAYRQDFNNSTEIKNLKSKSAFKKKPMAEQQAELDARFLNYVRAIESDKVYYFLLAYTQPNPVVIVRGPNETKGRKVFLGYEWSSRKGDEGIKYIDAEKLDEIKTPLFDSQNRNNPKKINYYIQQNFAGQVPDLPESLKPYVSFTRLVDLLDFGRVKFDKRIGLSPQKTVKIPSKWPYKKLGDKTIVLEIINGGTPDTGKPEYWNGDIPWATLVDLKRKYIYDTERKITKEGLKNSNATLIPENAVVWSSRATIGRTAIAKVQLTTNQGFKSFVCNPLGLDYEYLYYLLSVFQKTMENLVPTGTKYKEINKTTIENFEIPVPPLDVQQQIVVECQAIDDSAAEILAEGIALDKVKEEIENRKRDVLEKYL